MISMTNVTPDYVQKEFAKAKDHQQVEFSYMAPVKINKNFKMYMEDKAVKDWDIVKITRMHAVTNCDWANLPRVKEIEAQRKADIEAGIADEKREHTNPRNKVIPHILEEQNGVYYLITYPTEGFSCDPYIAYCIIDDQGNIIAEYDSQNEEEMNIVKEFIQPSYFTSYVNKQTGEKKERTYQLWRIDRMYELYKQ